MYADLHLHTYFSDSSRSPEEVALLAKETGIGLISVCDHDRVDAYDRLRPACVEHSIRLIPGVELSCIWNGLTLHVLGLGIDTEHPGLVSVLQAHQLESDIFDEVLIGDMAKDFPELSLDDYPDFQRTLSNGGWKNTNYMMAKSLTHSVDEGYQYFPKYATYRAKFVSLEDGCRAIREAGGVPILAHPGNWWADIPENFGDILSALMEAGIGGIECYYPSHSPEMIGRCLSFCLSHGLCVTAGSDDHGVFNRVIDGVEYAMGVVLADEAKLQLEGVQEDARSD